jgi:hypothetical protein
MDMRVQMYKIPEGLGSPKYRRNTPVSIDTKKLEGPKKRNGSSNFCRTILRSQQGGAFSAMDWYQPYLD